MRCFENIGAAHTEVLFLFLFLFVTLFLMFSMGSLGTDIDEIAIRSEPAKEAGGGRNKNYNYRVVMKQGAVTLFDTAFSADLLLRY